MSKGSSGSRTMLLSVLMSAPGPLIMGLGLRVGHSSTQLADFLRRSAELLALVVAFLVYQVTWQDSNPTRKARLERCSNLFVGLVMCLSGGIMLALALLSQPGEKGNVIPGLVIAVLGVVANGLFWRKYTRLSRESGNPILAVQGRLYGAKTFVDACVTAALGTVALFPHSGAAYWLDLVGSAVVALYLVRCGVRTVRESREAA